MSDYVTVIRAYRRIKKAFTKRTGVRLTAEEVETIWLYDDAVSAAVNSADDEEEGGGEGE